MKSVLEINKNNVDKTVKIGFNKNHIMVCPPVDENYWTFRVKLCKDQAVLGFPKFAQIGVGMALEEDWNTNLPTCCTIEEITQHIKHNKKYKSISLDMIREAVKMIKDAAEKYGENK